MLLKTCRCGKLIPQAAKMCETCMISRESRHVEYNRTRRDKKTATFYMSKEWRAIRPMMLSIYNYIDIYQLYINNEIVTLNESSPVHHIIEIEEDWSNRLNPLNLMPMSDSTHSYISTLYARSESDKKNTQKLLYSLINKNFKDVGGIKKVLEEHYMSRPPKSFVKTPHEEIFPK